MSKSPFPREGSPHSPRHGVARVTSHRLALFSGVHDRLRRSKQTGVVLSVVLLLSLFGVRPAVADSIAVGYTLANGSSGSTYTYTLTGSVSAGNLLAIYFPYATSANLVDASSAGADFTTSVLAPDASIPADGEFDILANSATSTFSGIFSTTFTYTGTGIPGAQSFTLFDSSFAPITSGTATAAASTAVTPEPNTFSLLVLGLASAGFLLWMRRTKAPLRPGALAGLAMAALLIPGLSRAQGPGGGGTPPTGGTPPGGSGGGGSSTLTGLTIGPYTLQSSYRVSAYAYNYRYTTTVTNTNATVASNVLGTLTSSNANTVVVSGSVEFGSVPALGSTPGLTTFTIQQDRRYAFNPLDLSWAFTGSTATSTVGTGASSVSLNASPTSTSYGTGVTLTATVSPSAGTGTITFFDGPVPLGSATLSSGSASLSGFVLPAGSHTLAATYSGDSTYAAGSSAQDPVTITAAGAVTNCAGLAETALVYCLANAFEATLTSSQLSTLQLSYTLANAEHWSNLPISIIARNGLSFGSLSSTQLAAALQLAQAAMSAQGYQRLQNIRGADNLLSTYNTSMGFGAGNYYVAFIGTPSTSSPWQLQFAGHHFAFNHTYNGTYTSSTPYFIGTEPTIVPVAGTLYLPMEGPRSAAYALTRSIYGNSSALLSGTFDDVVAGVSSSTSIDTNYPISYPTTGRGLLYTSLTQAQQAQVKAMIEAWVNDTDSTSAAALLSAYESDAALASTYVGYAGDGTLTTQGDYIRVDGPRVWIEFVVQNGIVFNSSYHFHTIWRDKTADYGGDFASQ